MTDLYAASTPNRPKASVTLEELELPDRVHPIDLGQQTQKEEWFLEPNPDERIPVIVSSRSSIAASREGSGWPETSSRSPTSSTGAGFGPANGPACRSKDCSNSGSLRSSEAGIAVPA
jgi:hypothetical protein